MRKEWERLPRLEREVSQGFVFGYPRSDKQQPDTIILRGVPSRWFAEPRVSSKPSMLVTHTIFSSFGKIRNLDVGEDNDIGQDEDEDSGDLVSGLHCKIVVQFESHKDFYNALKVLCGRSLIKQGSRMRSDYEVTWDRDGYFRNGRNRAEQTLMMHAESGSRIEENFERHRRFHGWAERLHINFPCEEGILMHGSSNIEQGGNVDLLYPTVQN
ncbi:hypothetical protein Salat_0598100 [Sesamum alatum]|uniref:Uncharacterized protein n=1 Tax=Sesamum alatum TaxID=300844 RepID=A0AAE1YRF4_9LAMI|nr:hypothetical protein Salat_0598100 [Sesamum alatum]